VQASDRPLSARGARGEIEICHARGHGDALSARTKNILNKYFSLNVCVSNVFAVIQSCDTVAFMGIWRTIMRRLHAMRHKIFFA